MAVKRLPMPPPVRPGWVGRRLNCRTRAGSEAVSSPSMPPKCRLTCSFWLCSP
jgi:hypothetical protein